MLVTYTKEVIHIISTASFLASGGNSDVLAINSKQVAKVFQGEEEYQWAVKEYTSLHIVYSIAPGLYPKPFALKQVGSETWHVVMERLYPLQSRAISSKEKEIAIAVMYEQWYNLHQVLANWDIARMTDIGGGKWDNVLLCQTNRCFRIRFIDMGNAKLVGHRLFERAKSDDLLALEEYTCLLLQGTLP
jgi:hypothetical protein